MHVRRRASAWCLGIVNCWGECMQSPKTVQRYFDGGWVKNWVWRLCLIPYCLCEWSTQTHLLRFRDAICEKQIYMDYTSDSMFTFKNTSCAPLNLFAMYSPMSFRKKNQYLVLHIRWTLGVPWPPQKSHYLDTWDRPDIIKRRCILGCQHSSPVFLNVALFLPILALLTWTFRTYLSQDKCSAHPMVINLPTA